MDGVRTIVIDDDPIARRLISDALAREGINVVAQAACGREGVERALYHRPDVVVMDYMMPGMDGVEATRRIRAGIRRSRWCCSPASTTMSSGCGRSRPAPRDT